MCHQLQVIQAVALAAENQFDRAREIYRHILDREPQNIEALRVRVLCESLPADVH